MLIENNFKERAIELHQKNTYTLQEVFLHKYTGKKYGKKSFLQVF